MGGWVGGGGGPGGVGAARGCGVQGMGGWVLVVGSRGGKGLGGGGGPGGVGR